MTESGYRTIEVKIRGTIQGPIWWPVGEICSKYISETYTPENKPFTRALDTDLDGLLTDALSQNDADFQWARFSDCYITVIRHNGTTARIRSFMPQQDKYKQIFWKGEDQ